MEKLSQFKQFWRKNGAGLLVFACFFSILFGNHYVWGVIAALMLTVPCGLKAVNNTPWLWKLRQLYFALIAITQFYFELSHD